MQPTQVNQGSLHLFWLSLFFCCWGGRGEKGGRRLFLCFFYFSCELELVCFAEFLSIFENNRVTGSGNYFVQSLYSKQSDVEQIAQILVQLGF